MKLYYLIHRVSPSAQSFLSIATTSERPSNPSNCLLQASTVKISNSSTNTFNHLASEEDTFANMKLQLLVVLSAFSALSLQSPLPQTTAALSSATDLPISAPSEVTPTPIKLFGDETQGGSMASSFSSDLSSAIANPGQFMQTHHWVIPALLVVLALFIGVLIWGYKRRQAKREEEEYDDQDDGGKQGSNSKL